MATRTDLIDRMALNTGDTRTVVKAIVQHFLDETTAQLVQGNRVERRDSAVFETRSTPARVALPRTLEKVHGPARRRVVFKPGRLMREGLNGQT
jgi:nucleoid DNA-binding protein